MRLWRLANALHSLGRTGEATESYERALIINPGYAEVHFNLGVLAMTQGRHQEAANRLRRAVEIKPDFAQANHSLGTALASLDQLDAAEESFRRALSLQPNSAEILHDLATILRLRGKSPEAVDLIIHVLEHAPTRTAKTDFVNCVARTRFRTNDSRIRAALTSAILEPWGSPYELCQPALSLVMLDQRIGGCVRLANELVAREIIEGGAIRRRWPCRAGNRLFTPCIACSGAREHGRIRALPNLRPPYPTRDRIERSVTRRFGYCGVAILRRSLTTVLRQRVCL